MRMAISLLNLTLLAWSQGLPLQPLAPHHNTQLDQDCHRSLQGSHCHYSLPVKGYDLVIILSQEEEAQEEEPMPPLLLQLSLLLP
jgi:hypothetical protein